MKLIEKLPEIPSPPLHIARKGSAGCIFLCKEKDCSDELFVCKEIEGEYRFVSLLYGYRGYILTKLRGYLVTIEEIHYKIV